MQAVSTANTGNPFSLPPERDNSILLDSQPRLIASTPQPEYEYEYVEYYEYYDDEEGEAQEPEDLRGAPQQAPFTKVGAAAAHPPPVKTIGDYDLLPLVNKVLWT